VKNGLKSGFFEKSVFKKAKMFHRFCETLFCDATVLEGTGTKIRKELEKFL